ncbi:hypothetical protein EX30DRAFT_339448 [Ascodesmis nigricans]|uniref:Uncharacterized protein n=1 Tax=Ascodesmis nigricans TaxID=341454 RepID=A0A4S2N2K6_9PEZI|nr:hypothetical protein EX30DRAFT_339448 [Ascodesmis nigricans]
MQKFPEHCGVLYGVCLGFGLASAIVCNSVCLAMRFSSTSGVNDFQLSSYFAFPVTTFDDYGASGGDDNGSFNTRFEWTSVWNLYHVHSKSLVS